MKINKFRTKIVYENAQVNVRREEHVDLVTFVNFGASNVTIKDQICKPGQALNFPASDQAIIEDSFYLFFDPTAPKLTGAKITNSVTVIFREVYHV